MNLSLHSLAEKIRRNEPISLPLAALLTAASHVTPIGMSLRMLKPRVRVDAHVISFGNITAGGTGKTPAVIERARAELAAGKRVAVLTRGYGSDPRTHIVVTPETRQKNLFEEIGDEATLIFRKAPGVIIVKSPDRAAGAQRAVYNYSCDVLILDDGYQYVQLERDENILMVDAVNPFGNGHLIPRGILREPIEAVERATAICITRCDQATDVDALVATLKEFNPSAPIRKTRHVPKTLWNVQSGEEVSLEFLTGRDIKAVCGIASPEAFVRTLESLGAIVQDTQSFPDHADIPPEALGSNIPIITTEKDAVRIEHAPSSLYALGVELVDCE